MAKTNRRQIDPVERRQRLARVANIRDYQRRSINHILYGDSDEDFEDDDFLADEISSSRTNRAY